MRRVYLIPGFFGFSSIGRMRYFDHVQRALSDRLSAEIHTVPTVPTAGLETRARRLAETVLQTSAPGDEIHLVGHSTGGVDARWVTHPAWTGVDGWRERVGQISSVVSIASPHHGAPLASYFATALGESWLALLSAATLQVVRLGPLAVTPIGGVLRGSEFVGGFAGASVALVEDVRTHVIEGFDDKRRRELEAFFAEVRKDRSLLRQLQPRQAREIDLRLDERPGVRYGSVIIRAGGNLSGVRDEGSTLFEFLHERARWDRDDGPPPAPTRAQDEAIRERWSGGVSERDTDAIVPTLSQIHGEVISVAEADHLDVLGFFNGPKLQPPHQDWLKAPPRFTSGQFRDLWEDVADWVANSSRVP